MYLCYIDESGTSSIPGNTSHFILTGISIPIWHWSDSDRELGRIKQRYQLQDAELHTAWILRPYPEQLSIPRFDTLPYARRKVEVERLRNTELLRLQRSQKNKQYKQTKKNFKHTSDYIHLTHSERKSFITEVAQCVSGWGFARLFAECIDKIHFDPNLAGCSIDQQSFEQLVSRFEKYLQAVTTDPNRKQYGLLIHDNNETVARKHTKLMKSFHQSGTLWTQISNIIETPLFVDSQLTGMVQIADLCAYALRRYLENGEKELFAHVFKRADRRNSFAVGTRHFCATGCVCQICANHGA